MESFNPTSISFTDSAINHFKNSLIGKPENFGIRIGVKEAGCSGYEYFFEYTNEDKFYSQELYHRIITLQSLQCRANTTSKLKGDYSDDVLFLSIINGV